MPPGFYQTGIKRDPSNYNVFRRVSDGEVVQLDGWYPGFPKSDDSFEYLYWWFYDDPNENKIFNATPRTFEDISNTREFICEYF